MPHEAGQVLFGWDALWLSSAILVVTYGVIISERINRAVIALVGASVVVATGVLDQQQAIAGIDFNTLALLIGMMIIVAISRQSGLFQYVAIWSVKRVKARPWPAMLMLSVVTALFSALLDNVTTVLLIVPVTLVITEELKVTPYPFLFAEILASNIGGTSTLIGDPPNILIGSATGLTFNEFLVNLAPAAAFVFAATMPIIYLIWGRKLTAPAEARARVMKFNEIEAITDWRLLKQALAVIFVVIAAFVLAHDIGMEPGSIALFGAAVLMLLHNLPHSAEHQSHTLHKTFGEVEWITIFFFVGLFVVVAGVEHAGLLKMLADYMLVATGGDFAMTGYAILWSAAVLSAIVDNIPFVATMIPLIQSMAPTFGGEEQLTPLWWALALGACLGGNGTLIGASANLTVAGLAERAGHPIRFVPFLLMAFPLMMMSVAISHVYMYLFFFD